MLFARAEPAEKRDYFRLAGKATVQLISRLADVAFTRHEDEDVARVRLVEDVLRRLHRGLDEVHVFVQRGRFTPNRRTGDFSRPVFDRGG